MRILMLNHHHDCLMYLWQAFRELKIETHVASEQLTKSLGFPAGGTNGTKFKIADTMFDPAEIYEQFKHIIFSDKLENYDKYVSIIPNDLFGTKTWWDCQMQSELHAFGHLNVLKTCNHPKASKFNFQFCPNWVPRQPPLENKKFITQIISLPAMVAETAELMHLKYQKFPIKIVGSYLAPDGFERDINILPQTCLLVHNKKVGINCYAVCKALDTGIPVYMEKSTKELIGFSDLPDHLFLFKEEMTIQQAYYKSLDMNNKDIQDTYRSIYTLDRTVQAVEKLLQL